MAPTAVSRLSSWMPTSPQRVWPIDDILELKKDQDQVGKTRMTVGMFGGAAVSMGLGIRMALPGDQEALKRESSEFKKMAASIKKKGNMFHFERVRRLDQLFNRLLALGDQRWELL
ncbi:hypothetical protein CspHIS471_0401770 [Cutaneotrichosporon sp. HIS471]|nr:hypothetical protein CspHIS471_0401770 [Cutaneotrichosporon sp. HIS471]